MTLSDADLEDLRFARALLENPSLAAKMTSLIGMPIERGLDLLPARWQEGIHQATRASLERALEVAVNTLEPGAVGASRDRFHRLLAAATGGLGGAFGLPALAVELPISTIVMLRSIADVARSEGERVVDMETRLACLEVFALGGGGSGDDAAETGYFAVRAALAKSVSEAARHLAQRSVLDRSAPALVGLIAKIASRFGATVSQKVAAQAVPLLGAAGGAVVNTLFIDHFQGMARGHFIVRRLERAHGAELVRRAYDEA